MPKSPEPAPDLKLRLLGVAFASADLLFEIDRTGIVTFALGAVDQLAGCASSAFVGSHWSVLVEDCETELLAVLLEGMRPGERQGPLQLAQRRRKGARLTRQIALSTFCLPATPDRISCAATLGGPASLSPRTAEGLIDAAAFADTAANLMTEAERAGLPLRMDLVELNGLGAAVAGMDEATADKTRRRVAAVLRAGSYAGLGASELANDRFALLRSASASPEQLAGKLAAASPAGVNASSAALNFEAPSSAQNLKAMRYALDRYIEGGPAGASAGFAAAVQRTVRDSTRFKKMLADSAFHLAYQPVVDLSTGAVHHYEALARFDANASPADTIRLAEELELIAEFDLAVAKLVAPELSEADDSLRVAINVSAASLMRPGFMTALLEAAAPMRKHAPRLLFELTETHALTDLPAANNALQVLRERGHPVCIDDFGAGAASLDYLRHFEVDFVKVDGRYVKGLAESRRDTAILRHVAALCHELGIATIAEMVETADAAAKVKALGVTFGQGWHFGKPLPLTSYAPVKTHAAKRSGLIEQWI